MLRRHSIVLALGLLAASAGSVSSQDPVYWETYTNPSLGYSIELPLGRFEVEAGSENGEGLRLLEVDGPAQIEILGNENSRGSTPDEFADFLIEADRIRTVTYRAGGERWFVLSGYYEAEEGETEGLIFYTKYLFNRDYSAFAAFEISYPEADKGPFSFIVTRMEKSLRAPDRIAAE